MAYNSELVTVKSDGKLPNLARRSCERSGTLYSTCTELAVQQLSSHVKETFMKIKTNQIPPEAGMKIFYAISKESISLMDNTAAQPMITELLHTALVFSQTRNLPLSSVLSRDFLQKATDLIIRDTIHCNNKSDISYNVKTLLWESYLPSYEAVLVELLNVTVKEGYILKGLEPVIAEVRGACQQFQHIRLYTEDFMRFSIKASKNNSLVIAELNQKLETKV